MGFVIIRGNGAVQGGQHIVSATGDCDQTGRPDSLIRCFALQLGQDAGGSIAIHGFADQRQIIDSSDLVRETFCGKVAASRLVAGGNAVTQCQISNGSFGLGGCVAAKREGNTANGSQQVNKFF